MTMLHEKDFNFKQIAITNGLVVTMMSNKVGDHFRKYKDDFTILKEEMEELCDTYVEGQDFNIHTVFTQPDYSFLDNEIRIVREYSF